MTALVKHQLQLGVPENAGCNRKSLAKWAEISSDACISLLFVVKMTGLKYQKPCWMLNGTAKDLSVRRYVWRFSRKDVHYSKLNSAVANFLSCSHHLQCFPLAFVDYSSEQWFNPDQDDILLNNRVSLLHRQL